MTKADVVTEISYIRGQPKTEIAKIIDALIYVVKDKIIQKETIYLRGFGNFQAKHRPKRHARNIRKNTAIVVEAYDCPTFKPSKEFIDQVKKGGQ